MSVTLKDIARELGLSVKAVSTGVTGTGRLAPETRRRIQEKAAEMGYLPNVAARTLAGGRTRTIGMVSGCLTDPFYAGTADAAYGDSTARGYQLLLSPTRWSQEEEARCLENLIARKPDGIFYCPTFDRTRPYYERARQLKLPFLMFSSDNPDFSHVHSDVAEAFGAASLFLAGRGCRSAAFCYLSITSLWRGVPKEAAGVDIEFRPPEADFDRFIAWLIRRRHPALILRDNQLCRPILAALKTAAPDYRPDIILGYDDYHTYIRHPQIAGGIRIPTRQMVRRAVDLLIGWIENGRPDQPLHIYEPALFYADSAIPGPETNEEYPIPYYPATVKGS